MKIKRATIYDVALHANVSQSTVSRVFKEIEGRKVKDSLKEKVLASAKELGYSPNMIARSLASGKIDIIALVTGGTSGPFYNSIIRNLIKEFQKFNKQLLIFDAEQNSDITSIIEKVLSYKVDGIAIMSSPLNKNFHSTYQNYDTPIVLINRKMKNKEFSYVSSDHILGGEIVAKYILDKKFESIAYVGDIDGNLQEIDINYGFNKISNTNKNIKWIKEIKTNSTYKYEDGQQVGREILKLKELPEVIFCTSDMLAVGVMDTLKKESNLKIPEDISIIGYDNANYSGWDSYNLTSVEQCIEKITKGVVQIMLELITTKNESTLCLDIPTKLIERDSSKKR